jgi:hypothetical protein
MSTLMLGGAGYSSAAARPATATGAACQVDPSAILSTT